MSKRSYLLSSLIPALLLALSPAQLSADLAVFELTDVFTDRGGQMTGQFTWTYDAGDFANGVGEFTSLDVPHTTHGLEDLIITIETTQIEITLNGSFHDDGVDVFLSLVEPFSPFGPAALDLDPTASKYSIGGNGFIDGSFISGSVTPVAVPEPSTSLLLLCCLAVFAACHVKAIRRKAAVPHRT